LEILTTHHVAIILAVLTEIVGTITAVTDVVEAHSIHAQYLQTA